MKSKNQNVESGTYGKPIIKRCQCLQILVVVCKYFSTVRNKIFYIKLLVYVDLYRIVGNRHHN
jgi:hypothetical protein